MKQKRILAVQDLSCFGKCSLSMAISVITAMGHEAVALPTALLSTHTGEFKNYTFLSLEQENRKIMDSWEREKITFDAIYAGYLGTTAQIQNVMDLIDRFGKNTVVLVDPAMAENGELYSGLSEDYAKEMKKLCKKADFITPNPTELSLLGEDYNGTVIKTGVQKGDEIGVRYGEKALFKPNIKGQFYGTGDAFSAAFISSFIKFSDVDKAVAIALEFVWNSIKKTLDEKEKYWYGTKFEQNLEYLINQK